jgi:hypothetical protein
MRNPKKTVNTVAMLALMATVCHENRSVFLSSTSLRFLFDGKVANFFRGFFAFGVRIFKM